jgi:hypothetical protein
VIEWQPAFERPPPQAKAQPETAGLFYWTRRYNAPMRTQPLLVLCLAFFLRPLPAQQSTQTKIPKGPEPREYTEAENAQNKTGTPPKPAVAPATGAKGGLPHEPQPCCTEQRSPQPLTGLEIFKEFTDAFSPWVLAIIGALGICAALKTLRIIRRQAADNLRAIRASEVAAVAARKSADALINSERAWVVVNTKQSPQLVEFIEGHPEIKALEVEFVNRGRTPARLTGTVRVNSKIAKLEELPSVPDFAPPSPGVPSESEFMLSPNETLRYKIPIIPSEQWSEANKERAEDLGQHLFVYASVLYYAFGDETLAELGICYMYVRKHPGRKEDGFIRRGPKGYNKQT